MLQPTENRETLIHRASERAAFARTVENGQFYITNESVMDGNSSIPSCTEHSEPRNSQILRLQAILDDHVKIGPVTGIEVFNQICRNFGCRSTSTITTTRKFEVLGAKITRNVNNTHDNLFLPRLTTRLLEPRQHSSYGARRPRAQTTGGIRQ